MIFKNARGGSRGGQSDVILETQPAFAGFEHGRKGAKAKEFKQPLEDRKDNEFPLKGRFSPKSLWKGTQHFQHFDFSTMRPMLYFWPTELYDKVFCFEALSL